MRPRRVAVAMDDADYSSAYEIERPAGGPSRSAELWARAVWEGAPRGVRLFLVAGWVGVLGFRLGPRPSPDHVLGWAIDESTTRVVVLESRSRWLTGRNVVHVDDTRIRWTTSVRFDTGLARLLWLIATPVHHLTMSYLLTRATRPRA